MKVVFVLLGLILWSCFWLEGVNGEDGVVSAMELRGRIVMLKETSHQRAAELKELENRKEELRLMLLAKRAQYEAEMKSMERERAELSVEEQQVEVEKEKVSSLDRELSELQKSHDTLNKDLSKLDSHREELRKEHEALMEKLQNMGMGHYVETHVKGLSPIMQKLIVKSTDALSPVVDYVSIAVETNNRLVDHVSSEIDKFFHVNVKKSPFMSGLLFYFVLLVPVLTVNVLLIRLIQTTMKFTITHFVILISTYFFLTCVGCSLSSVLLKSDVNLYLMSHHRRFYYVVLLGMTIIYLWHLGLVGLQLFITKDRLELSQFVASLCIALHYFLFVWRPSFLDKKPQMFTAYYLIYATIFGFLVVERASRLKLKHLFTNPVTRWLDSLGTIDLHMLTPNSLFLGVLGVGMMMWKSVLKRLQRSRRSARTWRKKADKRVSKRKTSTRNGVFNVMNGGGSESMSDDYYGESPSTRNRTRRRRGNFFSSSIDSSSSEEEEEVVESGWFGRGGGGGNRRGDKAKNRRGGMNGDAGDEREKRR